MAAAATLFEGHAAAIAASAAGRRPTVRVVRGLSVRRIAAHC
ncbi:MULTISPECIES: hypothetical protein [unclassified Rhodococcus (in: high G+C Gram-positive bacteria)]|nr:MULTISPECIES: hypothetical protein [unclassified Rhodococcus (in: high G+C Gram-positive bacteria)]